MISISLACAAGSFFPLFLAPEEAKTSPGFELEHFISYYSLVSLQENKKDILLIQWQMIRLNRRIYKVANYS